MKNTKLHIKPRHYEDGHLTPRETEVVRLLADGFSALNIASILGMAEDTALTHRYNAMRKMKVSNRAELVTEAIRRGIAPCPCGSCKITDWLLGELESAVDPHRVELLKHMLDIVSGDGPEPVAAQVRLAA